ncbi:hypothetical protein Tco_1191715 [Tanacetum coccineum]
MTSLSIWVSKIIGNPNNDNLFSSITLKLQPHIQEQRQSDTRQSSYCGQDILILNSKLKQNSNVTISGDSQMEKPNMVADTNFLGGDLFANDMSTSQPTQSFDLNVPKDSSNTDEASQNGGTPKSVTFEIHPGGCFTPTPRRSYIDGQTSSVYVVDIDEFCLHDLKDMMAKYVKDNKIILVYVEHRSSNVDSSIFVTPKKGVAISVDNHLRKAPIEIGSSPNVNRNLTHMCHVESADDPFRDLDEILGDYANTGKQIIGKQMMLFETEGVGPIRKFKEVEVDADNESKEEIVSHPDNGENSGMQHNDQS